MTNIVQLIAATVPPQPIQIRPYPEDFRRRQLEIQLVLSLVKGYLDTVMTDAAANSPGSINLPEALRTIDADLFDLSGDVCGMLENAAEDVT